TGRTHAGRLLRSAAIGFAGLPLPAAVVAAVLAEQGPATAEELRVRCGRFQLARGWRDGFASPKRVPSMVSLLGGLVVRGRLDGVRRYLPSPAAKARAAGRCPYVAVRGRDLAGERFEGFARVAADAVVGEAAA
ncbi:MAG: hypothetical protein JWO31_3774, partial [Phycisphaerales bacterium]|nr:hypothetical protein [Phycisphaerales bacterium]